MIRRKELVVQHATDGDGNWRGCKPITRTVAKHYLCGRVLDSAGEPWKVKLGSDGKYYTQMEAVK